ncbi:inner membrane protein [Klebsiella pneumoniae]|uniref:Inner membrane protein n=1 Tax=Klebsiella pneumoniae TaxID=573 RepID=A0A377TWF4_KLEPN|nr:inner membrane protein [Klebsiella pneumoniae]
MMLMGAALMRSSWLKGQFSLRHYRRTGALLVAAGMAVNLPAIFAQWYLAWDYRWCAFLLQAPRELSARCRLSAMPRWPGATGAALPFPPGGAIACVDAWR